MGDRCAVEEHVILVDADDRDVGTCEKLTAHQTGKLHRAFSVFVFNSEKLLLLQQRAASKYHSGGLWSNTCCGHPRPGEAALNAAQRRLPEEMGFAVELHRRVSIRYELQVSDGLRENEYNHVFVGEFDGVPAPNPAEVGDWRWVRPGEAIIDARSNRELYSPWFPPVFEALIKQGGIGE